MIGLLAVVLAYILPTIWTPDLDSDPRNPRNGNQSCCRVGQFTGVGQSTPATVALIVRLFAIGLNP